MNLKWLVVPMLLLVITAPMPRTTTAHASSSMNAVFVAVRASQMVLAIVRVTCWTSAVSAAVTALPTVTATATVTRKMRWVFVEVIALPMRTATAFAIAMNLRAARTAPPVTMTRMLRKTMVHVTSAHARVNPPVVRRVATL